MPEKEYIEREALLENLHKFAPEHNTPLIQLLVTRQPTADVAEVKHGEWKEQNGLYSCSICGKTCPYDVKADVIEYWTCYYCPNCGAKMNK